MAGMVCTCSMFGVPGAEKGEDNWISISVTGGNWKNGVKQENPINSHMNQQGAEELSRRLKRNITKL